MLGVVSESEIVSYLDLSYARNIYRLRDYFAYLLRRQCLEAPAFRRAVFALRVCKGIHNTRGSIEKLDTYLNVRRGNPLCLSLLRSFSPARLVALASVRRDARTDSA